MESVCSPVHQQSSNSRVENRKESHDAEKQSLLQFSIQMCRKHGLVKDRVTLLSPSDFFQIVQLCYAQVQKRMGNNFHAESSRTFNLARTVFTQKQNRCMSEVQKFLHIDDVDNIQPACTSLNYIPNKTPCKSNNTSHTDGGNKNPTNTLQDVPNVTPCKSNSALHMMADNNSVRTPCTPQNIPDKTPSKPREQRQKETDTSEMDSLVTAVMQEYDRFLASSNHVDALDILQTFLVELIKSDGEFGADLSSSPVEVLGRPQDPLQAQIAHQLADKRTRALRDKGTDSPQSQTRLAARTKDSTLTALDLWPETDTPGTEDSGFESGSQVAQSDMSEEVVQELFVSYVQLLVNTRSELALARVFNSPDRGLTHHAFTHLKHLAHAKHMALYQTATSVITKLRLGGRGYAPDPDIKLLQYVKGLTLLADLMNSLQHVLEDTLCVRSSVLRVVGVVRKSLIGCKSQRYKRQVVEGVGAQIQKDLERVLERLQGDGLLISPDKPACQGGSLTSRRPRRVLLHYLDQRAAALWGTPASSLLTWLHDVPFGPHTPSRFPCILSQFRSPAAESESSPVSSKAQKKETAQGKRKMMVSTNLLPEDSVQPLLQRCAKRLCDTVIVLPSKTIVQPAESRPAMPDQEGVVRDKENLQRPDIPPSKRPKKAAGSGNPSSDTDKGPAVGGSGQKKDQPQNSGGTQSSKQAPKAGKKCRRRLLSPVKGQRAITSFFRV